MDTREFITRSMLKHGDTYDYSESKYIKATIKVKIRCPVHGIFEQRAHDHMYGCKCPHCTGRAKLTTKEFIRRAKKKWGDGRYDYSLVEYTSARIPVPIICPKHGEFPQRPGDHLYGKQGCKKCQTRRPPGHKKPPSSNSPEKIVGVTTRKRSIQDLVQSIKNHCATHPH